ncbi:MAG TPA: alpha/beta hydrolase, partial [Nevskiaceae bacterium]|nr:alpha/beta hydrolase [Nevskiaceae bacterium]
ELREAALAFSCANGFYAIAAARAAPQRVRRLLLCQTPGLSAMPPWTQLNVPWPVRTPLLGQALVRATRRTVARGWYGGAEPDREQRAKLRATADHALAHGGCFCLAGVVQGLSRARPEELAGVKCPAQLIWGDADKSHRHTRAESLQELLPQASVEHWPECGHFPELSQPRRYAERVLAGVC